MSEGAIAGRNRQLADAEHGSGSKAPGFDATHRMSVPAYGVQSVHSSV